MNFDQTLDAISTILRNTDDLYAGQAHGHLDELQINHYNLINKHEALQAKYDNLKNKYEQVLETNSKLASTIQEQHTLIDDLKHRVAVERDTSAKYARQLATAKEEKATLQAKYNYLLDKNERLLARNNQLLVENAELEKRIEELE